MTTETIVVGGGCFWCLESAFHHVEGVISAISGYAGGQADNPTYEAVCTGKTGHAEVVELTFDPSVVSLKTLLNDFFALHDPTTLNRQGNDIGTQYRSVIYLTDSSQQSTVDDVISSLACRDSVVTEVGRLTRFYKAESYHQRYYEKNPAASYCQMVITPKLTKFLANR